jgi:hypothetical protein
MAWYPKCHRRCWTDHLSPWLHKCESHPQECQLCRRDLVVVQTAIIKMFRRHNSSDKTLLFLRLLLDCRKDLHHRRLGMEGRKSISLLASHHHSNKVSQINYRQVSDRQVSDRPVECRVHHLGYQLGSPRRLVLRRQRRSRVLQGMGGAKIAGNLVFCRIKAEQSHKV